jgi:uncharacterized protein with GYD domain
LLFEGKRRRIFGGNQDQQEEAAMPKFLFKASYSPDGLRGLMKEGGSARRANLEKVVAGVGGRLEAFYYAYGDTDVYGISDLPDAAAGIALSLE